jgi:hypothetical protein
VRIVFGVPTCFPSEGIDGCLALPRHGS